MRETHTPVLTIERRVYNGIHWHYDLDEQKVIWKCLWLARQHARYAERCVRFWAGICVLTLMLVGLWQFAHLTLWLALLYAPLLRGARAEHVKSSWYRLKEATLVQGKEEYFEEVNRRLSEARFEMEEGEPTIDIDIHFEEDE